MGPLRTVTALFTDLVGSTGMEARIGPAKAEELRVEYFTLLREVLAETGGREVKSTGDGVMAVFPSVAGAVDCAVVIEQRIDRRNEQADEELSVRVGLNLGDAVAENGDYFGLAVNTAARLCDAAAPGQILTSDLVRAIVSGRAEHEFVPVGELDLKGLPEPTPAFEVRWEPLDPESAGVPLPMRLAQPPPTGYVGRAAERSRLIQLWAAAVAGKRQVAFLSGEPGIGKTRLATYAALEARAQGAIVLYGRCDEELGLPHAPFIEALNHLVEHAPQELLARHVGRHGGDLTRLVPQLALRVPDAPPPRETDPETERYLMWGAAMGLLVEASAEAPIAFVIDDLHWADRPTLSLLRHLVFSAPRARLMVIGAYRESDLTREHPLTELLAELRREHGVERIALKGLDRPDVIAIMEAVAGHDLDETGHALAHEVLGETDGNPFFVAEILRHLDETGALYRGEDGRWTLRGELHEIGLPQSVREVIGRRVERLGREAARSLGIAAVIGRDFDLDLLARVAEPSEDELLDVLDQAAEASILEEVGDPPGRFTFSHALVNHTLYEALGPTRRARVHRRVAEALEEICGDDPGARLGELAQHWAAAALTSGGERKALTYARRAGEKALADLAPAEALRWFDRALHMLDDAPEPDPAERCDVQIGLGEAKRQLADPGFRDALLEASRLARDLGDADRLAHATLANTRGQVSALGQIDTDKVEMTQAALDLIPASRPALRAQLLSALALELNFEPDHRHRRALVDEALVLVARSGDERAQAHVLHHSCLSIQRPDTIGERRAMVEDMRKLAERFGDPELRFWSQWLATHAGEVGDFDEVDRSLAAARVIADEIGQPALIWTCLFSESCRLRVAARLDEAEALAARAGGMDQPDAGMLVAGQRVGLRWEQGRSEEIVDLVVQAQADNPGISGFRPATAVVLVDVGRHDEARALLDAAAEEGFDAVPRDNVWSTTLALWAQVVHDLPAPEHARPLYDELAPWRHLMVWNAAVAYNSVDHYLGGLAATLHDYEGAVRHFESAIATAERIPAPLWLARTLLWYGQLAFETGNRARARELLERSARLAREHGGAGVERDATTLIAEVAPR